MSASRWAWLLLGAGSACTPRAALPATVPAISVEPAPVSPWVGPALSHRAAHNALTDEDNAILSAIDAGAITPIDGLVVERVGWFKSLAHLPPEAPAYALVDDHLVRPVAWLDRTSGDVVEITTGYRHRVIDPPDTDERIGPNGELFFVYGYTWYPRWNRILPVPVKRQLEQFYDKGVEHVKTHLAQFRQVAKPSHSGGDLRLVEWNDSVIERMRDWGNKLPAAPYVHLPLSGTIDINEQRFAEAIKSGRVIVDEDSVEAYRLADRTVRRFGLPPSSEAVRGVLLAPFQHPDRYSPADRAIVLDAVYGGPEPMRIIIDPTVEGGFFVPDDGDHAVHVAYSEIDLNFRYNGLIYAKLAHEAHHVIEFRERPFLAKRCWHHREDMIETLKYLNEFMWWVERYPGDAPSWDWSPINAGIVLASLLEGYFPNSRC